MSLMARGRHPRADGSACRRWSTAPARQGGPRALPLRRLALRHGARHRRHGAAPQALPHARRQLRPAARRDAHRRPAPCARLQQPGGARGPGADRRRRSRRLDAAGGLHRMAAKLGMPHGAARPRPEGSRPRPRLPRSRSRTPTGTRARSKPRRCAPCSSAPGRAREPRMTPDRLQATTAIRPRTQRGRTPGGEDMNAYFTEEGSVEAVNARMGTEHQPAPRRGHGLARQASPRLREGGAADAGGMGDRHRLPDQDRPDLLGRAAGVHPASATRSASRCWSTRSTTAARRARPRTPSSARSMSTARRCGRWAPTSRSTARARAASSRVA